MSKVISFADSKKRRSDAEKDLQEANDELEAEMSFEEVTEKNKKNKERLEKERLNDNKSVLRSYRIKS